MTFFESVTTCLAATARRLHDTNRSGWNQLWAFTIIGIIPLLIWAVTPGDREANRFGEPTTAVNGFA